MKNIKDKTMFIGIGAQKTGTTWLADYLSGHPQVCFSPLKELHFFDQKHMPQRNIENYVKRLQVCVNGINEKSDSSRFEQARLLLKRVEMRDDNNAYMQYFEDIVENEKIFGEITPSYSMLDSNAFQEMKELHPNVKFIFIMRHPVDRYWSQVRFQMKSGKSLDPKEVFVKNLDSKGFVLRTDYKRTIEALTKVIDDKDILYLFYEDLFSKEKGKETVKKITDFLDIDFIEPDLGKSINVSKSIDLDDHLVDMAMEKFGYVIEYVDKFFEGKIPDYWKNFR